MPHIRPLFLKFALQFYPETDMSGFLKSKIARLAGQTGPSIKSIVKIAMTRRGNIGVMAQCTGSRDTDSGVAAKSLYILGNGPSLRQNIEHDLEFLQSHDTLAVNFAANSPEFKIIKPKFYLLADPHFFENTNDPNVRQLLDNLNRTEHEMTLFIPSTAKVPAATFSGGNLRIATFPFIAVEGWEWLENMAFSRKLGMPRPRNVLIPSIMTGAWLGYRDIYLLGADHSWLKTLDVTDDNQVVSVQPHFYKEDERELTRIRTDYVGRRLHEVLESMQIAFRSYHRINDWTRKNGISIYNATPGSMIDAFERRPLK